MPIKVTSALVCLLFFSACRGIDPRSEIPVLKQLEGTAWRAEEGSTYRIEIKRGGILKIHLGGVLGLAESPALVKIEDTNFVLASLYEDTPNPFLFAASILSSKTIKVYIWEYHTDLSLEEARFLLEEKGKVFKLS